MTTTDSIYQNQQVMNALKEVLMQSKKHLEFLSQAHPELSSNLESIAESMQTGIDILENQILFNLDIRIRSAKEKACKMQAYDFIATEKLIGRFKTFCECYPVNLYDQLTGTDVMKNK